MFVPVEQGKHWDYCPDYVAPIMLRMWNQSVSCWSINRPFSQMTFERIWSSWSPGRTNDLNNGLFTFPRTDKTAWGEAIVNDINHTCCFSCCAVSKCLLCKKLSYICTCSSQRINLRRKVNYSFLSSTMYFGIRFRKGIVQLCRCSLSAQTILKRGYLHKNALRCSLYFALCWDCCHIISPVYKTWV